MTLGQFEENYCFKTKIELNDTDYIELREPTQHELNGLKGNPAEDKKVFADIMPDCIVDHTITTEDGRKLTKEEVKKLLDKSGALYTEILTAWMSSIPFQSRLPKKAK